jgi:hypothetical protein
MALACTGRGPLAVPPGLMRASVNSPGARLCAEGPGWETQSGGGHKKTLARQGRELLAVPPWLTLPCGASTLSAFSCATPSSATWFACHQGTSAVRIGRSGGSSGWLLHRARTYPRLSEQRGNRTGPRQRVQYALVGQECTGVAGSLSTRVDDTRTYLDLTPLPLLASPATPPPPRRHGPGAGVR